MARPTKNNVEYFPHYTNARTGRTLFILERKYGNDGYAAWFKILELLGESPGHYFRYENPVDWMFLVTVMRVDEEIAVEMLQLMADVGAIDADLHAEKCLWSDNFVEGLRPVYAKRKQDLPVSPSFRDGNPSKEELSVQSGPETPQRKGKESKGEERESTSYSCPELSEPDIPEPTDEQVTPPVELSPEVMRIPLIQRDGEFIVRQEDVDQWSDTFPGVDVPGELKRIRQWNLDNPKKRKTKAGIRGHISTWLGKAQNSGSYHGPRGTPPALQDNRPRPTTVAQAVTLQNAELAKNLRVVRRQRRGGGSG